MPYLARITQSEPTVFLILVDQSGSMSEHIRSSSPYPSRLQTKAEAVADAINDLIAELVARTRSFDSYTPYYMVGVLGYSGSEVRSLIAGTTLDRPLVTPSELAARAASEPVTRNRTLPDGRVIETTTTRKRWIEPGAEWNTPMGGAMKYAYKILKRWRADHNTAECYPPTVINITDGEATDMAPDELIAQALKLRSLSTNDGETLLLNIHISANGREPVIFPATADELPAERYARLLFEMSSPMPTLFNDEIAQQNGRRGESVRGMAYNANVIDLVRIMNIGTSSSRLLLNRDFVTTHDQAPQQNDEFHEGLRPVLSDGLYGYQDRQGRVVITPQYEWVGDFGEGRAAVSLAGLSGLIDADGNRVIELIYDDLSWDGSRYAYIDMQGQCGVLDRMGEQVVAPEYDWVGEFSNGFAVVAREGRYGFVDSTGMLLEPGLVYDDANSVESNATAQVVIEGRAEVIKF